MRDHSYGLDWSSSVATWKGSTLQLTDTLIDAGQGAERGGVLMAVPTLDHGQPLPFARSDTDCDVTKPSYDTADDRQQ